MSLLQRSIKTPIRADLTWNQRWKGEDSGLIFCWERGRELRTKRAELASRASEGELVTLAWRGGVEQRIQEPKSGTLFYLATWQGLRGEDLYIDPSQEVELVCSKYNQTVIYSGIKAGSSDDAVSR